MIHFDCQHCGKPVRVPDAHAGKKGRCPSCHEVVSIPGGVDAIAELASAMGGAQETAEEKTVVGYVPPPPVGQPRAEEDPLQPAGPDEDLEDTVIIPAEVAASLDEEPIFRFPPPRRRVIVRPVARNPRRLFLFLAATIMILAALVIGVLIYLQFRNGM